MLTSLLSYSGSVEGPARATVRARAKCLRRRLKSAPVTARDTGLSHAKGRSRYFKDGDSIRLRGILIRRVALSSLPCSVGAVADDRIIYGRHTSLNYVPAPLHEGTTDPEGDQRCDLLQNGLFLWDCLGEAFWLHTGEPPRLLMDLTVAPYETVKPSSYWLGGHLCPMKSLQDRWRATENSAFASFGRNSTVKRRQDIRTVRGVVT